MKILSLSDEVVNLVQSPAITSRFGDVDVVLSCGDLPFDYLEYVVTMLGKRLYYVHGNHAAQRMALSDGTFKSMPDGCINVHHRLVNHCGLLIGGLEGSMRYREGEHQYTEREMRWLAATMMPGLLLNRLLYGRALDVMITHAPPQGIHDDKDVCHQGFEALLRFMDRYKPRYLIHGHTHLYRLDAPRVSEYRGIKVVNTFGYQVIEIDDASLRPTPCSLAGHLARLRGPRRTP